MDRKVLFDKLRSSSLFGGALQPEHVMGVESLLDAALKHRVSDPHHMANILAQVHHETGGYMLPVKETVYASHKDKNPSDATVIKRLDNAFAKGQLPWVKEPYWRDGWFGRGQVQITHERNYRKIGDMIGVNLVGNRDKMLDPKVSAEATVVGMQRGVFTGKKLSDYEFPAALSAKVDENPRRIINGKDGTDADVAKAHKVFYDALVKAGYSLEEPEGPVTAPTTATPEPISPPVPERTASVIVAEMQALLDELKTKL